MTLTEFLGKIWRDLYRSIIINQAFKLASIDNNEAAKTKLDYIYRKKLLPNSEFHFLKGVIEYKLGNYEESIKAILIAREKIESSKRYDDQDKNYMYCYSDRIIEKIKNNSEIERKIESLGEISKIDLDKVDKLLKENFPLIKQ